MSHPAGAQPDDGTSRTSGGLDRTGDSSDLVRKFAAAVGAVFIVVGILGFIPGVTENLDELKFAGHDSDAQLLGIFEVSWLHNIVHLLFGVAGLAMSRRSDTARTYLLVGGAIYLVLWVYGLIVGETAAANFVPFNTADDWLHFGLGVGMILLGLAGRRDTARTSSIR